MSYQSLYMPIQSLASALTKSSICPQEQKRLQVVVSHVRTPDYCLRGWHHSPAIWLYLAFFPSQVGQRCSTRPCWPPIAPSAQEHAKSCRVHAPTVRFPINGPASPRGVLCEAEPQTEPRHGALRGLNCMDALLRWACCTRYVRSREAD